MIYAYATSISTQLAKQRCWVSNLSSACRGGRRFSYKTKYCLGDTTVL